MNNNELPSEEEYTKKQIKRVMSNLVTILEICEPLLDNKTIELIYTCANDSFVRLDGITHYKEAVSEEV